MLEGKKKYKKCRIFKMDFMEKKKKIVKLANYFYKSVVINQQS